MIKLGLPCLFILVLSSFFDLCLPVVRFGLFCCVVDWFVLGRFELCWCGCFMLRCLFGDAWVGWWFFVVFLLCWPF